MASADYSMEDVDPTWLRGLDLSAQDSDSALGQLAQLAARACSADAVSIALRGPRRFHIVAAHGDDGIEQVELEQLCARTLADETTVESGHDRSSIDGPTGTCLHLALPIDCHGIQVGVLLARWNTPRARQSEEAGLKHVATVVAELVRANALLRLSGAQTLGRVKGARWSPAPSHDSAEPYLPASSGGRHTAAASLAMTRKLLAPVDAIANSSKKLFSDQRIAHLPDVKSRIHRIARACVRLADLVAKLGKQLNEADDIGHDLEAVEIRQAIAQAAHTAQNNTAFLTSSKPLFEVSEGPRQWVVANPVWLNLCLVNILTSVASSHGGQAPLRIRIGENTQRRTQILLPAASKSGPTRAFIEHSVAVDATDSLSDLNLDVAGSLARRMNGQLDLIEDSGQGPSIALWLDSAPSRTHPPPADHASATRETLANIVSLSEASTLNGGLDVLYVEDDPLNQVLMMAYFDGMPTHRLRVARDGAECLREVSEAPPDLLMLDLHLADIDGFSLLAQVNAALGRRIHAIAVSADASRADIEAARAAGFLEYWSKPLDLRTIQQRIADLASKLRPVAGSASGSRAPASGIDARDRASGASP